MRGVARRRDSQNVCQPHLCDWTHLSSERQRPLSQTEREQLCRKRAGEGVGGIDREVECSWHVDLL